MGFLPYPHLLFFTEDEELSLVRDRINRTACHQEDDEEGYQRALHHLFKIQAFSPPFNPLGTLSFG